MKKLPEGVRIVVLHAGYGCDTGCCGHSVEVEGEDLRRFHFGHPDDADPKTCREFAERLLIEEFGEEHLKDLVWDQCKVYPMGEGECWN